MRELAILVNYQSEQLNIIEDTLIKADQDVNNGEVKLQEAKTLHKKGNKVHSSLFAIENMLHHDDRDRYHRNHHDPHTDYSNRKMI